MDKTLWLVLRMPMFHSDNVEIIGVYDNRETAINNATRVTDIVGPLTLNTTYADAEWTGSFYPGELDGTSNG